MPRAFRHLSRAEITDIIVRFKNGATKAELAREFEVDHSTIIYHIRRFDRTYPENGDFHSYIKARVRTVCIHPSHACTICGTMIDAIQREERETIRRLREALARANSSLRVSGFPEVVE